MPDRVGPCRAVVGTVPDRAVPSKAVSPCPPGIGTSLDDWLGSTPLQESLSFERDVCLGEAMFLIHEVIGENSAMRHRFSPKLGLEEALSVASLGKRM